MRFCTLLIVSVTHFTNLYTSVTNLPLGEFLLNIPLKSILGFGLRWRWIFIYFVYTIAYANLSLSYFLAVTTFVWVFLLALLFPMGLAVRRFLRTFLQGQSLSFGLLVCYQRDFLVNNSRCFISRFVYLLLLLIISLLVIKTWYMWGVQILKYLDIPV